MVDTSKHSNYTLEELRERQGGLYGSKRGHAPKTAAQIEYGRNLHKKPEPRPIRKIVGEVWESCQGKVKKEKTGLYSYRSARIIVYEAILAQSKKEGFEFHFTEERKPVIRDLTAYFFELPAYDQKTETGYVAINHHLDLKKGIFLYGPTGTGKSFLMRAFQLAVKSARFEPRRFKITKMPELHSDLKQGVRKMQSIRLFYQDPRCLDDIGFNSERIKVYGNEVDVLQDILLNRYSRYTRSKELTHVTSNLEIQSSEHLAGLDQSLDQRVVSRMSEMFNVVLLDGPDYRKQKP